MYIDHQTGKTMDRPAFNRLMDDVKTGKVKTIVVWRLDRLGRTAGGLTALFDELKALKVNLISLKDGLDLSTPAGTLMANVLASVAQYETEVRAERIHAGLAVAKANGKRLGRKPTPDGKGPRIKVTTEQEAIVKRLKSEGQGVSAIARTTGLSRPTVYSIIGQERPAELPRRRSSPRSPSTTRSSSRPWDVLRGRAHRPTSCDGRPAPPAPSEGICLPPCDEISRDRPRRRRASAIMTSPTGSRCMPAMRRARAERVCRPPMRDAVAAMSPRAQGARHFTMIREPLPCPAGLGLPKNWQTAKNQGKTGVTKPSAPRYAS